MPRSLSTLAVACCSWFCWYFRTSRCVSDDFQQVCRCARCCARLGLWRDENCGGPAVAARLELSSSWTRLFLRQVQFSGMVVDTPVAYNDMVWSRQCSFSAWLLIRPLRTTTWYGPDSAVLDKVVVLPVVFYGRCSFSARSLTRPLCTMTGVIVQTVQFLDKVVALPVVSTTGAHGSRRAENVWRCRRCSSALLGTSL